MSEMVIKMAKFVIECKTKIVNNIIVKNSDNLR